MPDQHQTADSPERLRAEVERLKLEIAELRQRHDSLATERHFWRYGAYQYLHRQRALALELWGPPVNAPEPPREIPPDMLDGFTMGGRVPITLAYNNQTRAANHPLVYGEPEIRAYADMILANLARGAAPEDWFVYGALDQWLCDALAKYLVSGQSVVNLGSITPWYEAMLLHFGARPTTIDYNPIIMRTERVRFMSIADWERERPRFDSGLSISSFEHDGLGQYGDPIDPEGDLKAMRKMKARIKPGGLLFLAVPTGADQVIFNQARVYGRLRLPLLLDGWERVDSFGFHDEHLDGNGGVQPLLVLRNA